VSAKNLGYGHLLSLSNEAWGEAKDFTPQALPQGQNQAQQKDPPYLLKTHKKIFIYSTYHIFKRCG
jgi:hypothetical protein